MLRRLRKGQSTAEYAIVIGLVIAAAVGMQVYVKRSIQAKIKDAADYNDSSASSMLTTSQYEPDYATSGPITSIRDVTEQANTSTGGGVVRTILGTGDVSTKTGTSYIAESNQK